MDDSVRRQGSILYVIILNFVTDTIRNLVNTIRSKHRKARVNVLLVAVTLRRRESRRALSFVFDLFLKICLSLGPASVNCGESYLAI